MQKRDSKYELLRIVAMFLIVLHHSIIHGALNVSVSDIVNNPINAELLTILESGGKIGVFFFVLITGYFMIYSHISLKKLIKLWLPIFFWSVICAFFVPIFTNTSVQPTIIIKSVFPISFNQYWFMTAYFFMYLLIPVLNKIVMSLNNNLKRITFIFLGLILIFSSIGSTTDFTTLFGEDAGSMLMNFCIVYCWGALIRINKEAISKSILSSKKMLLSIIMTYIIIVQLLFGVLYKTESILIWKLIKQFIIGPWTLFIVVIACCIFIQINGMQLRYSKYINLIATTTFGIYLISDNNNVRSVLWNNIFHTQYILNKPYAVLYVIGISILVFIICSILEYIRKLIFSNFENKIGNKLLNIQDRFINKISKYE